VTNESSSSIFTPRDAHNYRVFTGWMTGAALAFGTATILISEKLIGRGLLAWGLTLLSVVLLLVTVRAYSVFLRQADELLRKIHLDALALAFGTGVVLTMGYRLCERLGAPEIDINDPLLVMLLAWGIGQWIGIRRYAGVEEAQS